MKSKFFPLLLTVFIAMTALPSRADETQAILSPRVTAAVDGGDLVVTIDNPHRAELVIAYPLPLTMGKELGGIILEFRRVGDPDGRVQRLCSFLDADFPVRRRLPAGASVEERWSLDWLKILFCLDRGDHEVVVTYVDTVDVENTVLGMPNQASTRVSID